MSKPENTSPFASSAAGQREGMPTWCEAITRELEKDDSISTETIIKLYRAFKTVAASPSAPEERRDEVERLRHIVWQETQSVEWAANPEAETSTRNRLCAERRKSWPGTDNDCAHDGSCEECEMEMAEAHETAASKAIRAAGQRILARLKIDGGTN